MEDKILNSIKKSRLKESVSILISMILTLLFIILLSVGLISSSVKGFYFVVALVMLFVVTIVFFLLLRNYLNVIKIAINPLKASVFKKYGDINSIIKIIDEINNTIEYEDNIIVIAKEYIYHKNDYSTILAKKDIKHIHKTLYRVNWMKRAYEVSIVDKYNDVFHYKYHYTKESTVDLIIKNLNEYFMKF